MNARKILFAILFSALLAQNTRPLKAESPVNEQPLFGDTKKTAEQILIDERFVTEAIKATGSREKAFEQILRAGWKAVETGDLALATRRFNQGHLLLPHDYRVYWGLGTVQGMANHIEQSEKLFKQGAESNPKDARFFADYGFSIQQSAIAAGNKGGDMDARFREAERVFLRAVAIDPNAALPHARLAVIYFYLQQCREASAEVASAKKFGGEGLDPRFLEDLKRHCP